MSFFRPHSHVIMQHCSKIVYACLYVTTLANISSFCKQASTESLQTQIDLLSRELEVLAPAILKAITVGESGSLSPHTFQTRQAGQAVRNFIHLGIVTCKAHSKSRNIPKISCLYKHIYAFHECCWRSILKTMHPWMNQTESAVFQAAVVWGITNRNSWSLRSCLLIASRKLNSIIIPTV